MNGASKTRFLMLAGGLLVSTGCLPEPVRVPTQVKSAAEVKITVGSGEVVEEPAPQSSPAATPQPPGGSTMAAAPSSAGAGSTGSGADSSAVPGASPAPAASVKTTDGPAKFVGRVVVTGNAPQLPPVLDKGAPTRDTICSENAIPNESVVVGPSGGLAHAIVYMRRTPSSGIPAPEGDSLVLDQVGCKFIPHVAICRVGQPIHLKNSDPVAHNVKIVGLNAQFNQTIPGNDPTTIEFTFNLVERQPAQVRCDFHGWMAAYVFPLDHPWAAVTDQEGNFEIGDLPDGEWEFAVWHETAGTVERSVKVRAQHGQITERVFEVNASQLTK